MTREQVVELARAEVDPGADRIERVYGWEVERALTGVRAALAAGGSVVGLIIAAVFGEAGEVGRWQILAGATALAVLIGVLAFLHTKLRRLYGNYLESLRVLAVVQRPEETDLWIPSTSH